MDNAEIKGGDTLKLVEIDSIHSYKMAAVTWVCVDYVCTVCFNQWPMNQNCPIGGGWTSCTSTGGGGGGGGWPIPPTPGGGSSPGGGGGGSGGGTGNPTPPTPPCPFQKAWYSIIPEFPNPCPPPPPSPPPSDTLLNPCDHAATLGNNNAFKEMLQDLKNYCNDPNENREHSWFYKHTPNDGLYKTSIVGEDGVKGLPDIEIYEPLDGMAHSHFANSLSIFSPDDLWSLCNTFNKKLMLDSSKFTLPLVTAEGSQYMLMIENVTKFRVWAQKFTQGDLRLFKYLYEGPAIGIKESNTVEQNEKKFLKYIKSNGGAGLKVFRGNSSFTSWDAIGLDINNNVITVTCN